MEKVLNLLKTKKFWVELLIMTLGMLITAIAVYYFLVPNNCSDTPLITMDKPEIVPIISLLGTKK